MEDADVQRMTQQSQHSRSVAQRPREPDRKANRKAYQALVQSVADDDVFSPTAASIFECLSKARLSEDSASSAELSRQELGREAPAASIPEDLSAAAVAVQLSRAARLYAVAATKYVRLPNRSQAFRYFRRAAALFSRAARAQTPPTAELVQASRTYAIWAARVREEHARRSLCRRRLSLGLLRRQR